MVDGIHSNIFERTNFIELLLSKLCMLGLCCMICGALLAFTAGMIYSYNTITLYIAITDSNILEHILGRKERGPIFTIDTFIFSFKDDFWIYNVTHYSISLLFQTVPVDTIKKCGPQSNINLVQFVRNFSALINCKMFAVTAVPYDSVLYRYSCTI